MSSLYTDVVFFFFSKIDKRAGASAESSRSINPRGFYFHTRALDDLQSENRWSVNRLEHEWTAY